MTLYSFFFYSLSEGPILLTFPPYSGGYWVVPFYGESTHAVLRRQRCCIVQHLTSWLQTSMGRFITCWAASMAAAQALALPTCWSRLAGPAPPPTLWVTSRPSLQGRNSCTLFRPCLQTYTIIQSPTVEGVILGRSSYNGTGKEAQGHERD